MQFTDLGYFTRYTPDGDNPHNIQFAQNDDGQDFYDVAKAQVLGFFFLVNERGDVVGQSSDITALFPVEMRVISATNADALQSVYQSETRLVWDGKIIRPHMPTRQEFQASALNRIDQEHSKFLLKLTGSATVEERDTWPTKERAARAIAAGTATAGQQAMIGYEAEGSGIEASTLTATIIAKAEAFQALTGMAAGLKAKAKTAIVQATNEAIPIDQVAAAINAVFAEITTATSAAIAQWKAQTPEQKTTPVSERE
ncbi:hypothetical protein JI58_07910 [Marinosulfonomonas sp. PRT-SC04]|nr:hypothetical protein JI58_07910 [Marinosulfonomonas sp. PRT-SC04]